MYLDAPDSDVEPARLHAQLVALADRARPERPGCHGADSAQREDAVDVEARGAERGGVRDRVGRTREGGAQLIQAGANLRADRHHLGAGDQLAGLLERELERLRVDAVRLRHRDDAGVDPQQAQDRQVLVRLQTGSLRGVHDEQEEVGARRARDHRPDEPLVPGNVDQGEPAAVGQLERRVPELNRDPTPLLLGQAVRVLAGQCPNEPCLPMVDVSRRADRQAHGALPAGGQHRRSGLVDLVIGQRPAVEKTATVADDRDDRRVCGSK